jgi:hypothetical protein
MVDLGVAFKGGRRRCEQHLVSHVWWLRAPSDSWLHEIPFDPLAEPAQATVTVQRVST